MEDQHTHRDQPCDDEWAEVLETWERQRPDFAASQQDQVTVRAQIGGEEDRQGQFGDLTGLEGADPEVDPDACTIDLHPDER